MNPDFLEIRTLIERRYRRRIRFALHFTVFVLAAMVTTWYMLTQYYYTQNQIFVAIMVAWTLCLVFHWGYLRLANGRDQEIESAWERIYGKFSPDAAPSEQITSSAPNRLLSDDASEIPDAWVDEKPKRTLHEE
ncbi:MAG: hypothetical protein ABI690_33130 [Chloroflexota bacterium]